MQNVEGDYLEIVRWMDENPVAKLGHLNSHGLIIDARDRDNEQITYFRLNFGLFSVCVVNVQGKHGWSMKQDRDSATVLGHLVKIEDDPNDIVF